MKYLVLASKLHRTVVLFCVVVCRIIVKKNHFMYFYFPLKSSQLLFTNVYSYSISLFLVAVSLNLCPIRKINMKFSSLSFSKICLEAKWILDCLLVCNFYEIGYLCTQFKKLSLTLWSLKGRFIDYFNTLFHLSYIHVITCIWGHFLLYYMFT